MIGTEIVQIDAVTFGEQFNNISQGRFPDGAASLPYMSPPTPRAPNGAGNSAPVLDPIADVSVPAGQPIAFVVTAHDAESPPQTLSFSLSGSTPAGASIDGNSGLFQWTPPSTPSTNLLTVRVTDNGMPNLSALDSFTIYVLAGPQAHISSPAANGDLTLTFSTLAGKHYRVEYKNELSQAQWTILADNVLATGSALMVMDNIGAARQRFYRVVQLD